MPALASKNCNELTANTAAINTHAIDVYLKELDGLWQLQPDNSSIKRRFSFNDFQQAMAFVNAAADIAHQQDHHPEMQIGYNYCSVIYTTHSANGLSLKDFICAAKINEISV